MKPASKTKEAKDVVFSQRLCHLIGVDELKNRFKENTVDVVKFKASLRRVVGEELCQSDRSSCEYIAMNFEVFAIRGCQSDIGEFASGKKGCKPTAEWGQFGLVENPDLVEKSKKLSVLEYA